MLRRFAALIFLVVFVVAVGLREPRFFASQSIESVLLWMPLIVIGALGEFMVIVSGGIDISIGSILGFAGIGVGLVVKANPNLPVPVLLVVGCALGLLLGIVNASLITWAKISPLIVTIGTLAAFRGLTFLLSKGDQIDSSMIPDSLTGLANKGIPIFGVNVSWLFVIALVLAVVVAWVLRNTIAGRNLFAYGNDAHSAHLRGVSGNAVTFWVYALSGAFAGLGGVMYAARFGFVNPGSAGQNLELTVIAAVAIGGTKLTGGSGTIGGVLTGCLLLSCINVGLSVLGIDANWQMLAYGLVIVVAIIVDGLTARRQPV